MQTSKSGNQKIAKLQRPKIRSAVALFWTAQLIFSTADRVLGRFLPLFLPPFLFGHGSSLAWSSPLPSHELIRLAWIRAIVWTFWSQYGLPSAVMKTDFRIDCQDLRGVVFPFPLRSAECLVARHWPPPVLRRHFCSASGTSTSSTWTSTSAWTPAPWLLGQHWSPSASGGPA